MIKPVSRVLALAALAPVALAATAAAGTVKLTPVKGATYSGLVGHVPITVKVDRKGKTAKLNMTEAPAYCSSSPGAEPHTTTAAKVSKQGAVSATITFFTTGSTRRKLAVVRIKGHFYTFSGSTPVFQGSAKSTYVIAGESSCNGQESFQAVKG